MTIDIRQVEEKENRASHFEVSPLYLTVRGNLPHGYKFAPKNLLDAMHLIAWLKDWIDYQRRN